MSGGPAEIELTSLSEFHNSFTSSLFFNNGDSEMVDCPECGKPLKKSTRKAKYFCENSTCSVIFVQHLAEPSLMKITRKAEARSFESERIAAT
jgi:endogenous inhibitor of DNA gyrase (YacG/DUF329 family)